MEIGDCQRKSGLGSSVYVQGIQRTQLITILGDVMCGAGTRTEKGYVCSMYELPHCKHHQPQC